MDKYTAIALIVVVGASWTNHVHTERVHGDIRRLQSSVAQCQTDIRQLQAMDHMLTNRTVKLAALERTTQALVRDMAALDMAGLIDRSPIEPGQ